MDQYNIWCDEDINFAFNFVKQFPNQIPKEHDKTKEESLMGLIGLLQNSCIYLHDVMNESPVVSQMSTHLLDDVRKRYIAPLALRVLERLWGGAS